MIVVKRIFALSPSILVILYAIIPILKIVAIIFKYDFTLTSYALSLLVLTVITIAVLIGLVITKITLSKTQSNLTALLLPLSVINSILITSQDDWVVTPYLAFLCIVTTAILTAKFIYIKYLKTICIVITSILTILLLCAAFFASIISGLSVDKIIKTVPSPQNTYIANVIQNGQGAMGGNTYVEVSNNKKVINLLFCKFSKKPSRVYEGELSEIDSITISWENDNTLIIDGKSILINDE